MRSKQKEVATWAVSRLLASALASTGVGEKLIAHKLVAAAQVRQILENLVPIAQRGEEKRWIKLAYNVEASRELSRSC